MTQALNLANFANNLNTSGATSNAGLQNSSVTITPGSGLSGGGAVTLGSSVTLTNSGVTSITAGTGISASGSTGGITISNQIIDGSGNWVMGVSGTSILNSSGRKMLNQTGGILQVVQGILPSIFSTTSGAASPAATGLTASITPSSTSSKILVLCYFGVISSSSATTFGLFLLRNGTNILYGNSYSSANQGAIGGGNDGGYRGYSGAISYVDSPATTSSTTYSISFGGNGGVTVYLNTDGRLAGTSNNQTVTPSTIILMEIAG